ncbi:MAG: hypothetical protein Q8N99_07455 [Nanoarchaeota archaeon]|nr:hypothetical protein [Nanoarchaeota archaeon]
MKPLKYATIAIPLTLILSSIMSLIPILSKSYSFNNILFLLSLVQIIFTVIIYLGYINLGKYTQDKALETTSWVCLILIFITNIFASILILDSDRSLFKIIVQFPVILLTNSIIYILLGIVLLRIKKVQFTRTVGILGIILGLMGIVSMVYLGPVDMGNISLIKAALQGLLGIVAIIFFVLQILMFYRASLQFEGKKRKKK